MTTPPDPQVLLRSKSYLRLLILAALLGVPLSAVAYGFLALVSHLQPELFTHLPDGLGFHGEPPWWPLPMLVIGGLLAGSAIRYLPGNGGHSPADGFKPHGPPSAAELPGVVLAALATLSFIGAAGGIAMSHLPGLPVVPALAMGIGAMSVVMLSLPLTSVMLATLLLYSGGLAVMPLVIVAVVVAYVVLAHLMPREAAPARESGTPGSAALPAQAPPRRG